MHTAFRGAPTCQIWACATSLHARGIVCGVRKEPPRRPRRPLRASHSTRARQAVVVERQAGAGTALERHE